jgi:hypothetical protein
MISPTHRPLPENTQYSQGIYIHDPGGIQTRNPSKRVAADPRLRPRGYWDGPLQLIATTDHTVCWTFTRSFHNGDHPTFMLLYVLRVISSYRNGSTKDKPMIKRELIKYLLILAKCQIDCSTKSVIALHCTSRRHAKHKIGKPHSAVRHTDNILHSGSLIQTIEQLRWTFSVN